jgi:hypothetical protein
VHRSLAAFWHDLVHGVLHVEGKIWRTLPLLVARPGNLTRRYIEGERTRFLSPVALFLFSVFLMFAVFSFVGVGANVGVSLNTRGEIGAALRHARLDLAGLEQLQARAGRMNVEEGGQQTAGQPELASLRMRVAAARRAVALLEEAERSVTVARGYGPQAKLPHFKSLEKGLNKLYENPTLMIYKLQTNAYKFSWVLIPLIVPLLWILFAFRGRFPLYHHTVFVTYSLSFMTLFAVLLGLLYRLDMPLKLLMGATAVVAPLHMYVQLKDAYSLSWTSALWRAALLFLLSGLAASIFIFLLLLLGALS